MSIIRGGGANSSMHHDDADVTVRLASRGDASIVSSITDAAYAKYIPRLGRRPEPMTVDYGEMIGEHPVHTQPNRRKKYFSRYQ